MYMFSVTSVMFAICIIGLLYSVYNPIRILYDACISYVYTMCIRMYTINAKVSVLFMGTTTKI